ncbi:hybrid sensor histidine kinase/response regulator [Marinilabilia rubra]|nr:response regulator [Marinilabilia rubra]
MTNQQNKLDNLRQAAELLLKTKVAVSDPPLSESASLKILHELEVHQLELEIQNEELIIAREKAEESERLKSSFLANMSHEIRTPMNGILGFTEVLRNFKLDENERYYYLDIIEKSGTRMLNIINDILSISKIESQQTEVSNSEVNVNEQVEDIYHFFKLEAEQKKLKLSFHTELPTNKAFFLTDREKVYEVLTNLVKNAIKFTQTGSVDFGVSLKGEFIEFYVRDSGPGIQSKQQESIFGRFMQGSRNLNQIQEGAGLGLSISKAYIEMLGGKIHVENNSAHNGDNTGATFFFTIPATPVKNKKAVNSVNKQEKTVVSKKPYVLVVENDEISRMLLFTMIEDISKEIYTATTGVEAVDICRKNPEIDLVLMDIKMPEMDGYKATQNIRKFNRDITIIAQTAHALLGDREKAIAAGCNNYISKPIHSASLRKMIIDCLSEKNKL